MTIGNVYKLKSWIQREADPLALSRWALAANKFVSGENIRLNRLTPADQTDHDTFELLRLEAEKIVGKVYMEEEVQQETFGVRTNL